MNQEPVYYCLECGYIGTTPGNCPECQSPLVADDVSLPHEAEEEENRYDDDLLEEEEDKDDVQEEN